jgi:hypothetical protein
VPAVYIVKLYPKTKGASSWTKSMMNSGMKGNVSTYKLNTAQISGIATGNVMPPSPDILAATIGVTFVGAGKLPMRTLPDMFIVRRQRVSDALVWLKANNPLYACVELSEENLQSLPENDVPDQILDNARYSDDIGALERESVGYVPIDIADEVVDFGGKRNIMRSPTAELLLDIGAVAGVDPISFDDDELGEFGTIIARNIRITHLQPTDPAVFPLMAHGVVDVHADSVPDNDISAHAFANTAIDRTSSNFAIQRGSAFVNEYARKDGDGQRTDGGPGDPNHMLGAFPHLFPYGTGGFETNRDVTVPYEEHVRWALQYPDGRFRRDFYFIFQAFGVIQKRQVCRSAGVQIRKTVFIANQVAFLKLRANDFLKASAEETRRVPFSNPIIRKLRKDLTSVRARVQGTDESRISVRLQVWGMCVRFNPPSIWATINLADTQDPIAQVLAGADIDLDKFIATAGPIGRERAINIASDPFAAAEFFHVVIKILLEEAFGINKSARGMFRRQKGVFGVVNGYVGTVEAQGWGTLHLHILFWLSGAPSAAGMEKALKTETFRARVSEYIEATIRADIDGKDAPTVFAIKKQPSVAYSRPVDPRNPQYSTRHLRLPLYDPS